MLRSYGPPGSENNHWYEASSIFSQGKAAMYTDANSLLPVIEDAQKAKVVGKVGYALFPRGPKGQYGSTVAAWGLAMPKSSKNQKAAWLFMQWATAREQVLAVQSEKGVLGARESVWQDPKGLTKVPADLRESLTVGSKVGTPLWNPPVVAVAPRRGGPAAAPQPPLSRQGTGAIAVPAAQGGDPRRHRVGVDDDVQPHARRDERPRRSRGPGPVQQGKQGRHRGAGPRRCRHMGVDAAHHADHSGRPGHFAPRAL